ncbi:MAG: class I SAM-dependent methyltransferase [Candidatus Omnitrophica bacterium]|nr:class I SAM-dependent methyltransferase [Candidatus Omnitrophota bacterium]
MLTQGALTHTECRICATRLPEPFLDLGPMPLANSFLSSSREFESEPSYPLAVTACPQCGLVQLNTVVPAERMFRQYPYVSSTSEAVRRYAGELAAGLVKEHRWGAGDLIVEIGSNDGLVLKEFQGLGLRVLGVDPALNVAAIASSNGVPTVAEFFSEATARKLLRESGEASAILGRHVFAHVDDLRDFLKGVSTLLKAEGVLLIEVPYLKNLIAEMQFDTIYHEHLSYISLKPVRVLCEALGLRLVDARPVALHGGSILLVIQRAGKAGEPSGPLTRMLREEERLRLTDGATLKGFASRVHRWKREFEGFIGRLKGSGAHLVGFGAAAKANTLLNFCPDVARSLSCILDRSPHKQGLYTPGTHIPVVSAQGWRKNGTTHMLILAWNFKQEVMDQMSHFAREGGRFIIPIPEPELR